MLSKLLSRSRTLKLLCVFLLFNVLGILLRGGERILSVVIVVKVHRPFFYTHYAKGNFFIHPTCVSKTFVNSNAHTYTFQYLMLEQAYIHFIKR